MVAASPATTFTSTQPTCTLAVTAEPSPLARWSDRPLVKDLQFSLTLNPANNVLRGNGEQLQSLATAVDTYLQHQLSQSSLPLAQSEALPEIISSPGSAASASTPDNRTTIPVPMAAPTATLPPSTISLLPLGWVQHQLNLGSLANPELGETIFLSATQLFDLANALGAWSAQMDLVPSTTAPAALWPLHIPLWVKGTVAAMFVAASAATLYALQNLSQVGLLTSNPTNPSTTAATPELANQPEAGTTADTKVSPSPFASGTPLPPPPNVTPPVGNPPTPLAQGQNSGGKPTPTSLQTKPGQPSPATVAVSPNLPPSAYLPSPSPGSSPPDKPIPNFGAKPSPVPVPRPAEVPPPPVVAIAPPPAAPLAPIPPPAPRGEAPASGAEPTPPVSAARPAPTSPMPDTASGGYPPPAPAATAPTNPSLPGFAGAPPLMRRTRVSALPQVAEAQAYFAQRWQPPPQLNQPRLEYSLILNSDGTLQRVVPLDAKAAIFLDRTPMPLANTDAFVSPLAANSPNRLRLVLEKSGQVKVLLEVP